AVDVEHAREALHPRGEVLGRAVERLGVVVAQADVDGIARARPDVEVERERLGAGDLAHALAPALGELARGELTRVGGRQVDHHGRVVAAAVARVALGVRVEGRARAELRADAAGDARPL